MRAVNLVPSEARRGGFAGVGRIGPVHGLVALLGIGLLFVTIYVLTSNTISERKAKVASLHAEANQAQATAANLAKYVQFENLARTRAETVRQIASSRFDWHAALSDLSKVVPANTSLQSLLGTVAPGATVNGPGGSAGASSGASTSNVRGDESGPAFELKGCTRSHDDVARLMSRLRLINDVTRVTLTDSQKPDQGGVASAVGSAAAASTAGAAGGCGKDRPAFDAVVFFNPIPTAGPTGLAQSGGSPNTSAGGAGSPGAQSATTSTTPATTSTTGGNTSTTGGSPSQPVSNTSSGSSK